MNFLFVCSRNKWRSRTAEKIFKNNGLHSVKSAGTSKHARIKISENLINWADIVFVMEEKHLDFIKDEFNLKTKEIVVLGIEDNYLYMDKELVNLLQTTLNSYFE
ncbi:MAG: low molecular weight protein tyrosine phosphatase family protein [Putridiphycobacter sp.]